MYILSAAAIASNVTGSTVDLSIAKHASSPMHQVWLWTAVHAHHVWSWLVTHFLYLLDWLKQPHILAVIMAWWITFTVLVVFGPVGVVPGTAAALYQAVCYGAFTPAGGIFATLTSLGMLGWLDLLISLIAMFGATVVAGIVWACGAGR